MEGLWTFTMWKSVRPWDTHNTYMEQYKRNTIGSRCSSLCQSYTRQRNSNSPAPMSCLGTPTVIWICFVALLSVAIFPFDRHHVKMSTHFIHEMNNKTTNYIQCKMKLVLKKSIIYVCYI